MKRRQELALKGSGRTDSPVALVVGSRAARGVAARLGESATVRLATADEELAQRARSREGNSYRLNDAESLRPVAEDVDVAVVTERSDRWTLLIARLLQACCGVNWVVAAIADDADSEASAGVDIELVSLDRTITGALSEHVPRLAHPG